VVLNSKTVARSDLLINLVKAGSGGDQVGFRRTLEALVAEERGLQHHVIANQLAAFLEPSTSPRLRGATTVATGLDGLVEQLEPQRRLSSLVLPELVQSVCVELIEEQQRADLLRSHGLEPRHRLLLLGPPGNGKTSLAEAVAGELAVPLLRIRYDAVVGSFLGETASRLARVFEQARSRQCVLFFDEFDAVGKARGDQQETGEIKRVVNSLLLGIDALPSYVVVVAATNHPELLDRAVWRRFQVRVELPPPSEADIAAWLTRFERALGAKLGQVATNVQSRLTGLSFAELEEFFRDVHRRIILDGSNTKPAAVARRVLKVWDERGRLRRA
jgi:AAA+ superfamily predicted ATPase